MGSERLNYTIFLSWLARIFNFVHSILVYTRNSLNTCVMCEFIIVYLLMYTRVYNEEFCVLYSKTNFI